MAYEVYFGSQVDQLMCQTLNWAECGHPNVWAAILSICLLPVVYLKRFRNIGYFSIFNLFMTLVAICLIVYVCARVLSQSPGATEEEFGIIIAPEDHEYVYWNFANLPMFCNTMMNLLEGNV